MDFLSGGFYKSTIHRVVQPPIDQRDFTRLGIFYFALPDDNVKLVPVVGSAALDADGPRRRFEDDKAPTVEEWRKGRTAAYGTSELKKSEKAGVEEEFISGMAVKHYS